MNQNTDMRWFSTADVCRILGKFDHVYIVGDSMMRQLVQALNILLREDLLDGAHAQWRAVDSDPSSATDCACGKALSVKCFHVAALDSDEVWQHDRTSVKCDVKPAAMTCECWTLQTFSAGYGTRHWLMACNAVPR